MRTQCPICKKPINPPFRGATHGGMARQYCSQKCATQAHKVRSMIASKSAELTVKRKRPLR